jgi:hypothetical protein
MNNNQEKTMKLRTFVLGGVASMSLIGAVAIAAPSFAQDATNPPQVSTPVERQQTQQLNAQAQDGTTTAPAALNGQAPAGTPSDSQVQYNAQQQQYQDQQQHYRDQRAQYIHDLHRYDVAQYEWTDYPARAYAYHYRDDPNLVHVDTLDRRQLSYTPVEGPDGRWVGRIRSVQFTPTGQPARLEIALNRRVSVFVNATDLVYDPDNKVIFTDLTRSQLWAMPGETIEMSDTYRP